jgi:hypothetical protein
MVGFKTTGEKKMEESTKHENIKELQENIPEVVNMQSPSYNGNKVANQFIIYGKDYILFQSYNSPIALKKDGKVYLFRDWDYSTTTGKYRNEFLGETKKETLAKLKSGEYIPVDFEILED